MQKDILFGGWEIVEVELRRRSDKHGLMINDFFQVSFE
jgi:hypothetical protein